MDVFLKRVIPPQAEPQAGPPGGASGGGAAITGQASSRSLTDPDHPPVGQDVQVVDNDSDNPDAG